MKKVLIAGVASIALAAMPVVGAMATANEITDTLTLNIASACTLERTDGDGSYTQTVQMGTVYDNFAKSTYKVICNSASGYSVSATFTSLADTRTSGTKGEAITYSATVPSDTNLGVWTAVIGNNTAGIAATNGVLMSGSGVTTGAEAVVTYKVGVRSNQAAGTYQGTATYKLSSGS